MKSYETSHYVRRISVASISSLALLASGCTTSDPSQSSESVPTGDQQFVPGCEPYTVFAQNRWPAEPYTDSFGAAVRPSPDRTQPMEASYRGNDQITVDGWLQTGTQVYPQNPPPFNNDVWFHVVHDGWVSYAGTRGEPTEQDPSGRDLDGGKPAELKPECLIK